MGWTSGYHSRKELVDYVTAHQENQVSTFDCIAKKFVGNHLWCVFERTAKPAPTDKERYIILFDIQRWGEGNWAYKDIQESMGPFQHSCPLSFLDMVPEPPRPAGYHDWRQGVRDYHARRNQKLTVGQTVKLTNGEEYKVTSLRPLLGVGAKILGCTVCPAECSSCLAQ